jgi:hypothetical protein
MRHTVFYSDNNWHLSSDSPADVEPEFRAEYQVITKQLEQNRFILVTILRFGVGNRPHVINASIVIPSKQRTTEPGWRTLETLLPSQIKLASEKVK